MKWAPDAIYISGVSTAAVGLWWERPSAALMLAGAALVFPVVLNWIRSPTPNPKES